MVDEECLRNNRGIESAPTVKHVIVRQLVGICCQLLLKLGQPNESFLMLMHSNVTGNEEANKWFVKGLGQQCWDKSDMFILSIYEMGL